MYVWGAESRGYRAGGQCQGGTGADNNEIDNVCIQLVGKEAVIHVKSRSCKLRKWMYNVNILIYHSLHRGSHTHTHTPRSLVNT